MFIKDLVDIKSIRKIDWKVLLKEIGNSLPFG